jgi:hypothetical protein
MISVFGYDTPKAKRGNAVAGMLDEFPLHHF